MNINYTIVKRAIGGTALMVGLSTAVNAEPILTNGDFEGYAIPAGTDVHLGTNIYTGVIYGPHVELPGWLFGGTVGWLASGGANSSYWGASSRFNTQFLVMTTTGDGYAALEQAFRVEEEGKYNFSLAWEGAPYGASYGPQETNPYAQPRDGTGLLSVVVIDAMNSSVASTSFLTSDGGQGDVSFSDLLLPVGEYTFAVSLTYHANGWAFSSVYIDNISVTPTQTSEVPEPSLPMLGVTAAAGLLLSRKLKKSQ
jgi:hypothetical protein